MSRALLARQNLRLRHLGRSSRAPCRIIVTTDSELPALAWVCRREGPLFDFTVGPGVETGNRGLFEGVWTGDFARMDRMASCLHFGSGAVFEARVLFVPPKHPLEHLYEFRDKHRDADYVSNSLCFSLAAGGALPGTRAFERIAPVVVERTHAATARGVYRDDPMVAEDDTFALLRVIHNNFYLEPGGRIRFSQPYLGRTFPRFEDYRRFLSDSLAALFANATHPARRRPLPPLTTVSSGYDSPAVAALAREHGCRDAVTIAARIGDAEDSGREIAEQLGLRVREFPHVSGRHVAALPMRLEGRLAEQAREFVATAGIGDDVTFLAFEPALAGRTLLTGAWGDSIWARLADVPPGLPVRTRFGKSLTEYRLRVGFAHVPVPFIGGLFPRSIVAISQSAEMAAYSVGGAYDRPIPRRIAESAGVDRAAFGRLKVATSPDPLNQAALWRPAVEHVMTRYAGRNGSETGQPLTRA
jgi:hypothetical protein